jgi:hypothetical protein
MAIRALADVVVLLHLAFIVFALFGGLLALRWRWLPWLHLPAVAWGAFVELTGRVCPLTPLEQVLRRSSGAVDYRGDFVEHYVLPLVYPAGLTRELQLALAGVLVVLNVLVYTRVARRVRRERALSGQADSRRGASEV